MHINESRLKFSAGSEILSAVSLLPLSSSAHHIFSFHGAGSSSKERILYLLNEVVHQSELGAFAFDFSGHGDSSGVLKKVSLRKREQQAHAAIEAFSADPLVLIGSSMGADTALRMLEHYNPNSLILFAPAIYSDEAFSVPFTEKFTKIVREPESWAHASKVLSLLREYSGNLLIVTGEDDTIIPSEVIDTLYREATKASRKEVMNIPGCDHGIHAYLQKHGDIREQVLEKILSFIAQT